MKLSMLLAVNIFGDANLIGWLGKLENKAEDGTVKVVYET
jgi:hypothetical protein